jgi:hypothetical protein
MKTHSRLMVFSLVACIGYTLAYYFEWSLFQYYFAENSIGGFWEQGGASGPPILWYGWLATAVIAGGIAAIAIPKAWVARLLPDLLWLVPVVLIFAALMYERRWFM